MLDIGGPGSLKGNLIQNLAQEVCALSLIYKRVLYGYPGADFGANEKPKGGPLEIELFLLRGLTKGVRGWSGAF